MELNTLKTTPQWFAVYTRSKTEKKVKERLSLAGFESFLPLQTVIKQWSDRKKKVEEPLIKSYVFVNTTEDKFTFLLNIPGVINILKYLGRPAVVRDVEIENLRIVVNNSNQVKTVAPFDLSEGEDVEVVKGPFKGLFATYIQHSGKHKVIVKVEVLNTFVEVTIGVNSIYKV